MGNGFQSGGVEGSATDAGSEVITDAGSGAGVGISVVVRVATGISVGVSKLESSVPSMPATSVKLQLAVIKPAKSEVKNNLVGILIVDFIFFTYLILNKTLIFIKLIFYILFFC